MGASFVERAPAKLNLGLRVLGRRPDGYHDLDSLFVRLALADSLRFVPLPTGEPDRLQRAPAADGWLDQQPLSLAADNLVLRALARYRGAAHERGLLLPGYAVTLTKRIPWGAGLAGGSADAAATLRALARVWPAGLDLAQLAAELGSDVPFCVANLPGARVTGRGEQLEPLSVPKLTLLLMYPRVAVATPDAFRWWGLAPVEVGALDVQALLGGQLGDFPNALEAPVATRVPAVARALTLLRSLRLGPVSMSGSGSTCYLVLRDATAGASALAALRAQAPDDWLCLTSVA